MIRLLNVSGSYNSERLFNITIHKELHNLSIPASPVCVKPPFFFLLFNVTNITASIVPCNKSDFKCILSQCWNGTSDSAVVMCITTYVPIPVVIDTGKLSMIALFRQKRDFGLTAAIIMAITLSAVCYYGGCSHVCTSADGRNS